MSAVRLVTIICDYPGCDTSTDASGHTVTEARRLARREAWIRRGTWDLCPGHQGRGVQPRRTSPDASPLAEQMALQGLTYRDLAAASTYDAAYLCRLANGHQKPSREAARAIAGALGVAPERLWGEDDLVMRRPARSAMRS